MAYVDPGSFASGAILTASEMQVIADDVRYLKTATDGNTFAGVSLLATSGQSIASGSYVDVTWGSAPIDVGAAWSTGASITVPASWIPSGYTQAIVEAQFQARFAANGTGTRQIQLVQNGTVVEDAYSTSAISGETTTVLNTVWAICAAGDVLKVQVQQNSGGALVINYQTAHIKRVGYQ